MKYVAYGASLLSVSLVLAIAVYFLSFFVTFDTRVVFAQDDSLGIAEMVGLGEVFSACGSLNFVPSSINITSNPPYAIGQQMTFWAFTTNVGDQSVTNTSDNMWQRFCMDNGNCYTNNTGVVTDSQGAGDRIMEVGQTLPSGDVSDSIVRTWTPTQSKEYTIYFCTDTNQGVAEYNESDNCSSRTFTVGSNLQPDYIPSGINMSQTSNIAAGQTITFSGFTTNGGNTAGGDAWQRFCIDNPNCYNNNAGIVGSGSRLRSNGTGLAAGAVSDPIDRQWVATQGQHTVYLCTDTAFQVAESNENNNCNSRTFTVGAGTTPDLTIVNLARTSGTISAGQNVTFSGNVRNSGTGNAGGSNARFCINNNNCLNSTNGRVGSDLSVSSLSAGQTSSQVSTNWTATGGTHTVYLCADVGKSVTESNEDNNCAQLGSFTVAAALPDLMSILQTRSGTLSSDGVSFLANNPMTFTGYVYNNSSVMAGSHRARMCINNTNCFNTTSGRIDSDENISTLGPNGMSPTMSRTWTPTTPGNYTLTMCTDINPAQVSESNEGNNCASTSFVVAAAQPDLVVQNLSRTPGTITSGQSVTFTGNVVNTGSSGAGGSNARFCIGTTTLDCLNSTTGRIGSDMSVPPLQAGQASSLLSANWTATQGTYRLYMCADVGKVVTESNENNNCAQLAQFTVADAQPDLRPINLSRTSGTINAGQNVVFTGNIRNDGALNAGASNARFCLSSTSGSGNPSNPNCLTSTTWMISEQGISSLSAGQTSPQLSTSWTATQGRHALYLCADVDQEVTESNESNNCLQLSTFTVGVASLPDLVIHNELPSTNAVFSPDVAGIQFRGRMQNTGTAITGPARGTAILEIAWNNNQGNPTQHVVPGDIAPLGGGDVRMLSVTVPPASVNPAITTNHSYRFVVDTSSEIDEADEGNNVSGWSPFSISPSVPVTAPPEITANPGLVDYGGTSQISWELNGHTGCWITATNGDQIGDSSLSPEGSDETSPIVGETLYTLTCSDDGSTDQATVRVRPIIEEI